MFYYIYCGYAMYKIYEYSNMLNHIYTTLSFTYKLTSDVTKGVYNMTIKENKLEDCELL